MPEGSKGVLRLCKKAFILKFMIFNILPYLSILHEIAGTVQGGLGAAQGPPGCCLLVALGWPGEPGGPRDDPGVVYSHFFGCRAF